MTVPSPPSPALGLRERKKLLTRQALIDAAEALFEEYGYDQVTVAQIASAANISVKTLFTYFSSKEDLAFADEARMRTALADAIVNRPASTTSLDAAVNLLESWIETETSRRDTDGKLGSFQRAFGDSAALQNRLRRMWQDYEDSLTAAVSASAGPKLAAGTARLQAMQIVLLVRYLTTPEVGEIVSRSASPARALRRCLRHATAAVSGAFEMST